MKIFLRRPEVRCRYGISSATLYRWIRVGLFPRPVRLGPNTVGWRVSDLEVFDANPERWRSNKPEITTVQIGGES